MVALSNFTERLEHGEQCTCTLLAQAIGVDPRAISFEFCKRVLQRHWNLSCHHGKPCSTPKASGLGEHWRHGVGPIDPVKAILISNDEKED